MLEGITWQIIGSLFLLAQEADPETSRPQIVDAPITAVHTPSQFDDNDVAQFIIEGEFPNTCYSVGRVIVRAGREELEQGIITFHLEALRSTKDKCLEVKTPFLKVVDLGILPAGAYSVVQLKNMKKRATLNVAPAKNNSKVDNFNYAPVDAAYLREDALGFRRVLVLIGTFTNSCMKFSDEVPVFRANDSTRVLEVLPIVEMKQNQLCLEVLRPFFKTIDLPEDIPSGRYLFHIRTMNGNSINKMDTITLE